MGRTRNGSNSARTPISPDAARRKSKRPKVVEQTFPILVSDREHVRQLFPVVADAMGQGFAIPNRASTFRSRKYCSFWRQCQQDYGGTVAG